jgi:hypothetical protein
MKNQNLVRCPFSGHTPEVVRKDVNPQGDPWFSGKTIYFVECQCGVALFNGKLHEGFDDPRAAADTWNSRLANVRVGEAQTEG